MSQLRKEKNSYQKLNLSKTIHPKSWYPWLPPIILNCLPKTKSLLSISHFFSIIVSHFLNPLMETSKRCLFSTQCNHILVSWYIGISISIYVYWNIHNHPTPRIPNSCCCYCCCSSVTKSVKWRYLGNQAWYHRSAGVKTTGKKSE